MKFNIGGVEYDYDIDAVTGKVLAAESETADYDDQYDADDIDDDDRYDDVYADDDDRYEDRDDDDDDD